MATCKVCGKQYHACGSCGLESWEYDYCGIKCYKEGTAGVREEMDKFLEYLTPVMKRQLFRFTEDYEELWWAKVEGAANGSK